ncbi:MAG TPA: ROK family protein [Spirochaetia bacterium]|nr:ROK family protein [Spirochaetia bacterium]
MTAAAGTERASVGIDLGASKANIGVLDDSGTILAKARLDIRARKRDTSGTAELICAEAARIMAEAGVGPADVGFIGMGVPGTIDPNANLIVFAPNLGWRDVSVDSVFEKLLGRRPVLVQDARAAALAEYLQGAGVGAQVAVCLTLGTGIGCGIIMGGRIYGGAFNTAGEIGHVVVEQDGEPCQCGQRGCLEAYASGTAIVRAARNVEAWSGRGSIDKAEVVFERAAAGDLEARRIIDRAVRYLGMGIVSIVNMLSPDVVIISGGMCEQEALLVSPVREYVTRRAYGAAVRPGAFRLEKARLGEDAPMIGAALLYHGLNDRA